MLDPRHRVSHFVPWEDQITRMHGQTSLPIFLKSRLNRAVEQRPLGDLGFNFLDPHLEFQNYVWKTTRLQYEPSSAVRSKIYNINQHVIWYIENYQISNIQQTVTCATSKKMQKKPLDYGYCNDLLLCCVPTPPPPKKKKKNGDQNPKDNATQPNPPKAPGPRSSGPRTPLAPRQWLPPIDPPSRSAVGPPGLVTHLFFDALGFGLVLEFLHFFFFFCGSFCIVA